MPVSPFVMLKWRNGHILFYKRPNERGKEKQMRSMIINRINLITRPAISGFDFPCLDQPQNNIDMIRGIRQDNRNCDRNRYRRK